MIRLYLMGQDELEEPVNLLEFKNQPSKILEATVANAFHGHCRVLIVCQQPLSNRKNRVQSPDS